MIVAGGIIVWLIWDIKKADFLWEMAIFRIIATAVLGFPAWFLGKEAIQHRKMSHYAKRIELELAALGQHGGLRGVLL